MPMARDTPFVIPLKQSPKRGKLIDSKRKKFLRVVTTKWGGWGVVLLTLKGSRETSRVFEMFYILIH